MSCEPNLCKETRKRGLGKFKPSISCQSEKPFFVIYFSQVCNNIFTSSSFSQLYINALPTKYQNFVGIPPSRTTDEVAAHFFYTHFFSHSSYQPTLTMLKFLFVIAASATSAHGTNFYPGGSKLDGCGCVQGNPAAAYVNTEPATGNPHMFESSGTCSGGVYGDGCTTLVPTNWTESYGSICDFHEISNAENRYGAACVAGNLLTDPPQYCFSAWCYVSKDCPSAVKSGEFPMATDLYYSYATCSNKDSYSETSSTSSGERLMVGAVAAVVGLVSLAM